MGYEYPRGRYARPFVVAFTFALAFPTYTEQLLPFVPDIA
jgi:hypothetical protein